MEKQVLVERITAASSPLKVIEGEGKRLFLEGIAIQGEVKNRNGRVYPKTEIERAVDTMARQIEQYGPIIGECDHPSTGNALQINLDRATHLIHEVRMEGNDGYAKIEVIPYGLGEVLYGLAKHGARLGVSSRGSGVVDDGGRVSGFDIITIDIVANPSAPDAYPTAVFESLGHQHQDNKAVGLMESIRSNTEAQEFLKRGVLECIRNINTRKVI